MDSMNNHLNFLNHGGMLEEQQVISEVLSQGVDRPQILLWQYENPAVIMGRSQRPDDSQIQRAQQEGLPIVRRGSGGGAVLAGPWMLSVTAFIPTDHPVGQLDIIKIFGWLEQIWIKALEQSGVSCKGVDKNLIDRSKDIAKRHDVEWACYASLSHGEVVSIDGRKLVGLAQIRKRQGVALVCGLHLSHCDWRVLCRVVSDNQDQAAALESLNADVEQLSGASARELLPDIIDHLMENLPDDFELLQNIETNRAP
ncbi:MAG: hypothetical protein OQK12_10430 [Motiliproteus sp.]|nr:hypothetical protein [Motiliproteus sp.]